MTPEQQKAMTHVLEIRDDEWRSRAVMLVVANNVDGLVELRVEVANQPRSHGRDWDCVHSAWRALRGYLP